MSRRSPSQRRRARGSGAPAAKPASRAPAAKKPRGGSGVALAEDGRPPQASSRRSLRHLAIDLAIMLGAFVVVSALAGAFGAANLGTALSFGQIGFGIALVYVLVRR